MYEQKEILPNHRNNFDVEKDNFTPFTFARERIVISIYVVRYYI